MLYIHMHELHEPAEPDEYDGMRVFVLVPPQWDDIDDRLTEPEQRHGGAHGVAHGGCHG